MQIVISILTPKIILDFICRFRIAESRIRVALVKLKLIEMGMVKESNELEDLYIPPSIFVETGEEAAAHSENILKQLQSYEEKYNHFIQTNKSKPSSATANLQREVIDAFQKLAVATKKCDSCGSFSPSLRKDGYTKLFEKPLQKKVRKSMQGMKIKLKVPPLFTIFTYFVDGTRENTKSSRECW